MLSNIWSLSKQKHPDQEKSMETYEEQICVAKGQIMSECIYEIIDFPKYHQNFSISDLEGFID